MLTLFVVSAAPAWSCDPQLTGEDVMRLESNDYVAAIRTRPSPIHVGQHFAIDVAACAKSGSGTPNLLRVDAHMPAHRHGMNYVPRVQPTGPGRWHAEGLLLHMPGRWEFRVDLRRDGVTDRLTREYTLD